MRLLLGMLLGAALTVLFAYVHDINVSPQANDAPTNAAPGASTLVNWNVARARWHDFTSEAAQLGRQAERGFTRLAGRP